MSDRSSHSRHSIQHRMIFTMSFTLYVFAGAGLRLLPSFLRRRRHRSLLAEAWAASDTIAQFAFAG